MGRKYENILQTIGDTPVVQISRLAPPDVNLYVKIEAFNPLGSVKDRLALGVIEDAERTGKLTPGQTVVEATSGNTGIGLAMVCAAKGYKLVIIMPESFSIERRRLMRFLGARVVLTPAAERSMGMVNKARELAEHNGWFLTRQFENEANADTHSRTTAREIIDDFQGDRLDYWVTGYGTGGTLKGVARVLAKERPDTRIVVCEPEDAPLLTSGTPQQRKDDGSPTMAHPRSRRIRCRVGPRISYQSSPATRSIRASSTRSYVSPAPMHCVAAATWHKRKAFSLAYPPERPLLGRCKSAPRRQMAPRSSACCPTPASAI
jgi:cysteine synthase